ncbi:MAG: hypothetical protein WCT85_01520 [Parachlamydiales bacterium]
MKKILLFCLVILASLISYGQLTIPVNIGDDDYAQPNYLGNIRIQDTTGTKYLYIGSVLRNNGPSYLGNNNELTVIGDSIDLFMNAGIGYMNSYNSYILHQSLNNRTDAEGTKYKMYGGLTGYHDFSHTEDIASMFSIYRDSLVARKPLYQRNNLFITGSYYLSIGTNVATTGNIRLANKGSISFRNAGNTANYELGTLGADNIFYYAESTMSMNPVTHKTNFLANVRIGGDSLVITDATENDSINIFDNGTTAIIDSDNPLNVLNNLTVNGSLNAVTSILLNGANINTAGTLTNVAYENQANVFTLKNTFQDKSIFSDTIQLSDSIYFYEDGTTLYINKRNGTGIRPYLSLNTDGAGHSSTAEIGGASYFMSISEGVPANPIQFTGNALFNNDLFVTGDILSDALFNSRVGTNAGNSLTTGTGNSLFGYQTGYSNTTGDYNLANGFQAGYSFNDDSADYNVMFGYQAGFSLKRNVNLSLAGAFDGRGNVYIGYKAGYTDSSSVMSICIGNEAGVNGVHLDRAILIGNGTGENANGDNILALGDWSARATTVPMVSIGTMSGTANTTGIYNSFYGHSSGYYNVDGGYNTALGMSANTGTNYSYNTSVGAFCGSAGMQYDNTLMGSYTGYNLTGIGNAMFGKETGAQTTSGDYNSFFGKMAGGSNTTGDNNTFVGKDAGYKNITGSDNVFVGFQSGYETSDNAEGVSTGNVFVGKLAGYGTGIKNFKAYSTAIGCEALFSDTVNNNTALGYRAGYSNITGSGNLFLGYEAGYNELTSNKLYIENSNSATPLIYGDFATDELTTNGDHHFTDTVYFNNGGDTSYFKARADSFMVYSENPVVFNTAHLLSYGATVLGNSTANSTTINGTLTVHTTTDATIDSVYVKGGSGEVASAPSVATTSLTGNLNNSTTEGDTAFYNYVSDLQKILFDNGGTIENDISDSVEIVETGGIILDAPTVAFNTGSYLKWNSNPTLTFIGNESNTTMAVGGASGVVMRVNNVNMGYFTSTALSSLGNIEHKAGNSTYGIIASANTVAGYTLTMRGGGNTAGGTADLTGGTFTLSGGQSKGTGTSAMLFQRCSRASTTGTVLNTFSDAMIIPSSKICGDNTSTSLFNVACASGSSFGITVEYTIKTVGGAGNESHTESGTLYIQGSNDGSVTVTVTKPSSAQHKSDAGTYTVTFAGTTANPSVISVTADSDLNVSSTISYNIINKDEQVITQL